MNSLINRRNFLKVSSVAAFAAGGAGAMGSARAATVDLGSQGLSPGDLIDPYLSEHLTDGNEVIIPEGTYQFNGDGLGGRYSNATIRGTGSGAVLDHGDSYVDFTIHANGGTVRYQNITLRGTARGDHDGVRVGASSGAHLILENFNRPDGSEDGLQYGFYVGGDDHSGELTFRNCEVSNFGNNGIYASGPGGSGGAGGRVVVEGGLFRNNNVASIRLGSDDSVARGATVIHDGRITRDANGGTNGRGIWVREGGDNITIEDCDIIFTDDADGATGPIMIQDRNGGGSGTIRNTRIRNDGGSDAIMVDSGNWEGDNIHITGSGNHSHPSNFTNVCTGDGCDVPSSDEGTPPDDSNDDSNDDGEDNSDDDTDVSGRLVEVIAATGAPAFHYSFVASGAAAKVTDAGSSSAEGNDTIAENDDGTTQIEGRVGNGFGDSFRVEGDLQSWEADTGEENYTLRIDGEEIDPSDIGSDDDEDDDDDEAEESEVAVVAADGGPAFHYALLVAGTATLVTDAGSSSAEGNDTIAENDDGTTQIEGRVGNGFGDTFQVEGDLLSFEADTGEENYTLLVDGQEVDPADLDGSDGSDGSDGADDSPLPNRISFEAADGQEGTYAFEVTGEVEPDPDSSPLEDSDVISDSAAEGEVSGDIDSYRFSGDVVNFQLTGAATVSIEDNE